MNEWKYSFWFKFNARKPDYTLTSEGKEKKIENRKQHYHFDLNWIYWSQKLFPAMSLLESQKRCMIYLRK